MNTETPIITTEIFRRQMKEDIASIQEELEYIDNINKPEFAFNYWILDHMYDMDIENADENITEYNDKGIDGFVHYEENNQLFIIQNKYYDQDTSLSSIDVSDFLTRPLATLNKGSYKNENLQKIYDKLKKDEEANIYLHFYLSNDKQNTDIDTLINNFNKNCATNLTAKFFYLQDIEDKYYKYEERDREKIQLDIELTTKYKGTRLQIKPEDYKLPNMHEAYYIMTPVFDIYTALEKADKKHYPLFEENIRDYLGEQGTATNKAIIETLKNENDRNNFFYYNNGITIICEEVSATSNQFKLKNPQVVNGCQTVNSIHRVLQKVGNKKDEYKNTYVMTKVLVIDKNNNNYNKFYKAVVKYTNQQNAINEKAFAAVLDPFFRIQDNLEKEGFLLMVKQSDKNTHKEKYDKNTTELSDLLTKANKHAEPFIELPKRKDIQLDLSRLLQITLAFWEDIKATVTVHNLKGTLLKPSNKIYIDFSTTIQDKFTTKDMIKLIMLYEKADRERKKSKDKKTPSPFYVISIFSYFLNNIKKFIPEINDTECLAKDYLEKLNMKQLEQIYIYVSQITTKYQKKKQDKLDYNQMVKQKIKEEEIEATIKKYFEGKKEHNQEEYKKIVKLFDSFT